VSVNLDDFDVTIPDLVSKMMPFDRDMFSALLDALTMG
jgi:hypothetical protein